MKNSTIQNGLEHNSGCFQKLSPEALAYISDKKTQISYLKEEPIIKQGAFASHVLFVNQGFVRVYLQTVANKQLNIRIAQKGDFITFSSVFGENINNYSAVALINSVICVID